MQLPPKDPATQRSGNPHGRRIGLIAAAVLATSGAAVTLASPAYAAYELGGIDVNSACHEQYGGSAKAVLVGRLSAWDWKCDTGDRLSPVDMNRACRTQYNYGPNVWAQPNDTRSPWSWRCYV